MLCTFIDHATIMQKLIPYILSSALLSTISPPTPAQQKLPVQQFNAGIYLVQAEVASTVAQRELGLMNRKYLGPNEGMMFVFDRPDKHCMWMKNTLIPLSVAFINNAGTILNIEEMQPQTDTNHCASEPALYALEMNANWFKHKNIKPGSKITTKPK